MNIKTILGLTIGAGALFFFSKKISLAKNAQFSLEKISINWKKKFINLVLGVNNPTSGTITINSILGTLRVNNNDIATVESNVPVTVKAYSKIMIPLILRPSALGLFSTLKTFFTQKFDQTKKSQVHFTGTAAAGNFNLPINTRLI
jgi:LEA14-like dessication related protein